MSTPMSRCRGRGYSDVVSTATIAYDKVPFEKAPTITTSVDLNAPTISKNNLPKIKLVQSVVDDYEENRKHPVATVYELYAKNRLRDEVEFVECHPGSGSSLYKCWYQCIISGVKFLPASGNSQKEAKERAGRVVLDHLLGKQYGLVNEDSNEPKEQTVSHTDLVKVSLEKLEDLANKNAAFAAEILRQDCAVFVRSRRNNNLYDLEVVSVGCGSVNKMSTFCEGACIRDCKALSLARRGLIRYFQNEIRWYCHNTSDSVLELVENEQPIFQVEEKYRFHLVLFQPPEIENYQQYEEMLHSEKSEDLKFDSYDHPTDNDLFSKNIRFTHNIYENEKLDHSANKLFKWNHVGLLGSKLSGTIKPVFLDSITAQTSPQLMAYVACCRSKIPVHHPRIGEDDLIYTFVRYPKQLKTSISWSVGFKISDEVEAVASENGQNYCYRNEVSYLSNFAFQRRQEKMIENAKEHNLPDVYHLLIHPNKIQKREYEASVNRYKKAVSLL
ncbi:DgyrCDS11847 [Dimorphilus gyrociliatus]|uniref:DgyrCDS11847 n=1 Tax=Dimorphilus gyrociliatus TaxID=2664684 RepID=A0A7I8W4M8_9ANNE|nr:DgyrCDS11847 [Dimorphilus gyrociliatus]